MSIYPLLRSCPESPSFFYIPFCLSQYAQEIVKLGKAKRPHLVKDDLWWRESLPKEIKEHGHITHEQLSRGNIRTHTHGKEGRKGGEREGRREGGLDTSKDKIGTSS
jgi:hypothetical protein